MIYIIYIYICIIFIEPPLWGTTAAPNLCLGVLWRPSAHRGGEEWFGEPDAG